MQIQSDYANRVYENHMAELKKLGEMTMGMMRDASKEHISRFSLTTSQLASGLSLV
jgi:hypothetical protein